MGSTEDYFDEEQLNRLGLEISSNLLSSNLYSVPIFRGDDSTNASTWIGKFETVCNHFSWSNDQARAKFKSWLAGPAANWYKLRIAAEEITDFQQIKRLFCEDFADEDKLEKMKNRKMIRFEKIQTYVYDKVGLCKEVNPSMTNDEILNYLYEGMPIKLRNAI